MYTQPIDRNHPGCILFLLDQSASMDEPFGGTGRSKAAELAKAVNRLLRNLVLQCQRGNEVRNYYDIGIVGYGQTVGTTLGGRLAGQQLVPISVIADYPLRMVTDSLPGRPGSPYRVAALGGPGRERRHPHDAAGSTWPVRFSSTGPITTSARSHRS